MLDVTVKYKKDEFDDSKRVHYTGGGFHLFFLYVIFKRILKDLFKKG